MSFVEKEDDGVQLLVLRRAVVGAVVGHDDEHRLRVRPEEQSTQKQQILKNIKLRLRCF